MVQVELTYWPVMAKSFKLKPAKFVYNEWKVWPVIFHIFEDVQDWLTKWYTYRSTKHYFGN